MKKTDRVLIISDLHLSPERPDVFQAFRHFVNESAGSAQALYILGDFFNLWIGDDAADSFSLQVAGILAGLADDNTGIFLMHGNRDFLLGDSFCKKCKAKLIPDPSVVCYFGQSYLLMHGDSLCTRDSDYMAFRDLVRNNAWQQDFLSGSVEERKAFAEQARARSRTMTSNKPEDIMDVTPDEVTSLMTALDQHILIHGHTHRPAIHDVALGNARGSRIVLGDWDKQGWYVEITPDSLALNNFPIQA